MRINEEKIYITMYFSLLAELLVEEKRFCGLDSSSMSYFNEELNYIRKVETELMYEYVIKFHV